METINLNLSNDKINLKKGDDHELANKEAETINYNENKKLKAKKNDNLNCNNSSLDSQSYLSMIIATLHLPIEETTFVNLDYNFDSVSCIIFNLAILLLFINIDDSISYGLKVIIENFQCKWMGLPLNQQQEFKDNENNLFIPLKSEIMTTEFAKNVDSFLSKKRRIFNSNPGQFYEAAKIEHECFDRINEVFAIQIEEKILENSRMV